MYRSFVDFGHWATSQKLTTTLNSGNSTSATLNAVDSTLTLVLTGSNSGLLGGGEDDFGQTSSGPDRAMSVHELANGATPSVVNVTRNAAGGVRPARWTAWAITFEP